jgi:hypothetical protein
MIDVSHECPSSSGPGPSMDGLTAYYAFVADAPLLDLAFTLGDLQSSGSPTYVSDCVWPGFQCAALTSSSDSSGGGQYFRVNNLNLGAMSESAGFSICTWFMFDAFANGMRIFDFGGLFVSIYGDCCWLYLVFVSSCGWNFNWVYSPSLNTIDQWRHLCVVNQGSSWSIYQNGALIGSSLSSGCSLSNVPQTSNFIGRSNGYSDPLLIGRVADFRIYQRALPSSDVAAIYRGVPNLSGNRPMLRNC